MPTKPLSGLGPNDIIVIAGAVVKGTGEGRRPVFALQGEHIVLRGRGVIDGSLCPTHAFVRDARVSS